MEIMAVHYATQIQQFLRRQFFGNHQRVRKLSNEMQVVFEPGVSGVGLITELGQQHFGRTGL